MKEPIIYTYDVSYDQKEKNAFWTSLLTVGLFAVLLIITLIVNESFTTDLPATLSLTAGLIAAAISTVLSRRRMSTQGILILIVVLAAITFSRVFFTKGQAIASGIGHIILAASIASYTLPSKWISRIVVFAFLVSSSAIIIDQFTTGIQLSENVGLANAITFGAALIYLIILLPQFSKFLLRTKLIIGFIALISLPVLGLGTLAFVTTQDILEQQIKTNISDRALSTATTFNDFVSTQFDELQSFARLEEIAAYMNLPASRRKGSQQEIAAEQQLDLIDIGGPTYITSYALVDLEGNVLLDTNRNNVGSNYSAFDFISIVVNERRPYAMALPNAEGSNNIYFAVPIKSRSGDVIGVYVVTYRHIIFQTTIEQFRRNNPVATTRFNYIIDKDNFFIIAHIARLELLTKSYLDPNSQQVTDLVNMGLVNPAQLNSRFLPQPQLVSNLSNIDTPTVSFRIPSPEFDGELAESTGVPILSTNMIIVTAEPISAINALTQGQTRIIVIVSIVLIAVAALLALVISNIFTKPLTDLTIVAESVTAGDFTRKSEVRTQDEVGLLSSSFNRMTDEIQHLISTLENRVKDRTAELNTSREVSEKRAKDFQTIAEIARYISTEKDLEKLLPLITRFVSERFGFYHVGIFLLDETKKYAVLRAANSSGGREMLRNQHKLEVGQTGIVGNVTGTGTARIALDTGKDAVFFNNPYLPDTRSEMALPLLGRGEVIGAIDVQSTIPNAFSDADIAVLSLLADQVAIAIDNVRLIGEAQNALSESQAIFTEYVSESWRKRTGRGILGYHQSVSGGKIITDETEPEIIEPNNGNGHKTLEFPIRVREHVIGVLNIRSTDNEKAPKPEDMEIINAVVERLGLALDNARLFEETSTRASREKLVTDITTKIRSSNDPEAMIKIAIDELKQALGVSRVEIVPKKINPSPDI